MLILTFFLVSLLLCNFLDMFEKTIVVDCKGHLLGRVASVVAKELLNGQHVVSVSLSSYLSFFPPVGNNFFCVLSPRQQHYDAKK